MAEITHRNEDGRMVQIVTPERLTAILLTQGESLSRPSDFGPKDEWFVTEPMTRFYISTDSASEEIEAVNADAAANEFARSEDAPQWVVDVETLERWLRKVGGYGCMRNEDTEETLFDIPS